MSVVRPRVEDAIALAARAHRGQRYPSPEGEPYIFHPLRLMLVFSDQVSQMAAVLHDAVEDSDLEIQTLVEEGYPAKVIAAVDCLSRRGDEPYDVYIDRVASNDVARLVKIADLKENLANNLRSSGAPGSAQRIAQYEAALARLGAHP